MILLKANWYNVLIQGQFSSDGKRTLLGNCPLFPNLILSSGVGCCPFSSNLLSNYHLLLVDNRIALQETTV